MTQAKRLWDWTKCKFVRQGNGVCYEQYKDYQPLNNWIINFEKNDWRMFCCAWEPKGIILFIWVYQSELMFLPVAYVQLRRTIFFPRRGVECILTSATRTQLHDTHRYFTDLQCQFVKGRTLFQFSVQRVGSTACKTFHTSQNLLEVTSCYVSIRNLIQIVRLGDQLRCISNKTFAWQLSIIIS